MVLSKIFNSRNYKANHRQIGDSAVGECGVEAGNGGLLNRAVGQDDVANKFMPCAVHVTGTFVARFKIPC